MLFTGATDVDSAAARLLVPLMLITLLTGPGLPVPVSMKFSAALQAVQSENEDVSKEAVTATNVDKDAVADESTVDKGQSRYAEADAETPMKPLSMCRTQ